ncbi:hypothetical protein AN478_05900 [Thiohalorhabdus denitrificans]|uniref:SmpA / OmlA family protein n=1 Tax=Thiohalorhabdus denitrificans TaxID=381306 RepID=A0A0P9C731_9GAMM|nr:hypothetical protein [Thiohalorhabdus denitrificans]KPV40687.1 hypothetical protein AN478_05900 [Thiohalorhabdus denitrificans]SCY46901.1 hypothetical protein SAMN05661077_2197 [Thiohalorhabdus denitrificans]
MRMRIVGVLGAVALLGGCAAVDIGKDFDLATFEERVEVGETQRTEVRRWLGEPVSTGQSVQPDGTRLEEWLYYHGRGTLPGLSDARLQTLEIQFREDGVVESYKWSGESG